MNEMNTQPESQEAEDQGAGQGATEQWETPKLEDVSEQVMAQPYIRFT
jgi:hypothetical protein